MSTNWRLVVYFHHKQNTTNKTTSIFALTTLCLQGSISPSRSTSSQVLVARSKHHGELTKYLPQTLLSLHGIPHTHTHTHSMMLRPGCLWGTGHHFEDFSFSFTLQIVLNDLGCMISVIVLLQDPFRANHQPLILTRSPTPGCKNTPPTGFTVPADAHYCSALQPFGEQIAFCYTQRSQFLPHQSR